MPAGNTAAVTNVFSVSPTASIRPLNLPAGYSGSSLRTTGYAINAAGQVAGEVDIPGGSPNPVRWDTDGTSKVLASGYGSPSQQCFCRATLARGIDDAGVVYGRLPDSAAKWLPDGTAVRLTSSTGALSRNDYPMGANPLGMAAGLSGGTWGTWQGSGFTSLPVPPDTPSIGWAVQTSWPMAINSGGIVAGTRLTNDPSKPVRAVATVADSSRASFLIPPSTDWNSYAAGINDAGDIVGAGGTARGGRLPGRARHPLPAVRRRHDHKIPLDRLERLRGDRHGHQQQRRHRRLRR